MFQDCHRLTIAYLMICWSLCGDLVVVPLGSRRVAGIVATLANAADCEDKRLKCISAVLHASSPLNAEWLALTKFAAIYYLRGWGEAALPAIPTALRRMPTPQQEKRIAKIREAMPIPDRSRNLRQRHQHSMQSKVLR